MAQQQQSNMIKPQKVGGFKKGMSVKPMRKGQPIGGMDGLYASDMKSKTMTKGPKMKKGVDMKKGTKLPSLQKVQKSIAKTMGY